MTLETVCLFIIIAGQWASTYWLWRHEKRLNRIEDLGGFDTES